MPAKEFKDEASLKMRYLFHEELQAAVDTSLLCKDLWDLLFHLSFMWCLDNQDFDFVSACFCLAHYAILAGRGMRWLVLVQAPLPFALLAQSAEMSL